jgi:hypothetical protein
MATPRAEGLPDGDGSWRQLGRFDRCFVGVDVMVSLLCVVGIDGRL